MLSSQRNTDKHKSRDNRTRQLGETSVTHQTAYSGRFLDANIETPKFELPQSGMNSSAAYQLIHDEMMLNSNPNMNLASFVTTWYDDINNHLINNIKLIIHNLCH